MPKKQPLPLLYSSNLPALHWIDREPSQGQTLRVRTRHRAKLIKVKKLDLPAPHQSLSGTVGNRIVEHQVFGVGLSNSNGVAVLDEEVRALTSGQSAVFYSGEVCLGGGIVAGNHV